MKSRLHVYSIMFGLVYVAVGLLGLYLLISLRTGNQIGKSLPGPRGWPVIGSIADMMSDNLFFKLSAYVKQYGDIYRMKVLGENIVVLNSAELIRKAFTDDRFKKGMNDRAPTYHADAVLYGSQSMAFWKRAYEPIHTGLRKGFTKAMHISGDGRKQFEDSLQEELDRTIKEIENRPSLEIEFQEVTRRFIEHAMSVLLRGYPIKNDEEFKAVSDFTREADYLVAPKMDALMKAFPFLRTIPNSYRNHYETLEKAKTDIIRFFIEETKTTYKDGEIRGFIDYMIKENLQSRQKQIPEEEIVYNDTRIITTTLEILVAGEITTLAHLSSTFLLLINYPEYQEKIQAEIDRVIGRDRLPTLEDKARCPLVEAVALETHRYIPAIPGLLPHVCRSDTEFEGYHIAKDSIIFPNIYHTHHDENVWDDPWTFRPERFLDQPGDLIPNDHPLRKSWLAFGTGRRQCVGESLARSRVFLFVTTLLQRWTFQLPPDVKLSSDPRNGDFKFNVVAEPPAFKCRLIPRRSEKEA